MKVEIGKQIQYYRKKESMTQGELAKQLHVTRQAISNWERGLSEPDLSSIQDIAKIFHLPIQTLVEGDQEELEHNKQLRLIMRIYVCSLCLSIFVGVSIWYLELSFITIVSSLIMFLMNTTVLFTFKQAIQTKDFTMIAGYDDGLHYDTSITSKSLLQMLMQITWMHVFGNMLVLFFCWAAVEKYAFLALLIFVVNFIASIILTSMKYRNRIFTDPKDQVYQREGMKYVLYFLGNFILLLASVLLTFYIHDIRNNTKDAFIVMGLMFLITLLHMVILFVSNFRIKKGTKISWMWLLVGEIVSVVGISCMLLFPYG
ncbi:MAG: helix-turn-helix transcriptional regulator [Longicatena sp.]